MNQNIGWTRVSAGHYRRDCWTVRSWRPREWWVFKAGAPFGNWREERGLRWYEPFRTMAGAMSAVNGSLASAA